ncbi:MAG: hypothetical protein ACKO21_00240 [Nodosilinea sp.]
MLLVAAAASLQTAMQEVTTLYIQANPNQTINYVITLQMGILVAYRMYRYQGKARSLNRTYPGLDVTAALLILTPMGPYRAIAGLDRGVALAP